MDKLTVTSHFRKSVKVFIVNDCTLITRDLYKKISGYSYECELKGIEFVFSLWNMSPHDEEIMQEIISEFETLGYKII